MLNLNGFGPKTVHLFEPITKQRSDTQKMREGMAFNEKEFRALMRPYTIMVAEQQ